MKQTIIQYASLLTLSLCIISSCHKPSVGEAITALPDRQAENTLSPLKSQSINVSESYQDSEETILSGIASHDAHSSIDTSMHDEMRPEIASVQAETVEASVENKRKASCRLLLTYNTAAAILGNPTPYTPNPFDKYINRSWSELVVFDKTGVHVQKYEGSIAYMDNQFLQIYPIEFRYKTPKEFNIVDYKTNEYLQWHAWYVRNLHQSGNDDTLLYYVMPYSCYIIEVSARKSMYKYFGISKYLSPWNELCDMDDLKDEPLAYGTDTSFTILENYLNIQYDRDVTYRYIPPPYETYEMDWQVERYYDRFTIRLSNPQSQLKEEFYDASGEDMTYLKNGASIYTISSPSPFFTKSEIEGNDYILRRVYNVDLKYNPDKIIRVNNLDQRNTFPGAGNSFIYSPIFYPQTTGKFTYSANMFPSLENIGTMALPKEYPPVFIDTRKYSYYSPKIPESLKPILDRIMRSPDGCGEFDWRTMTFSAFGYAYSPEKPDSLAGIAWVTTDEEIPADRLVKLPIFKVIE